MDLVALDNQLLTHYQEEAKELSRACLAYLLWLKELAKQAVQEALRTLIQCFKIGKMLLENYRLPFTTLKYCLDIYNASIQESSNQLKVVLWQPEVLVALVLLGTVSLFLSFFNETEGSFRAWPYARDAIKHLRNVYRGIQNTLNLIYLLDLGDATELIVPLSLLLGLISITNRIWYRYQSQARESLIIQGREILNKKGEEERLESLQILLAQIQAQKQERAMLASAILNGFMEGIHAYLGMVVLVSMSALALNLIAAFASVYLILSLSLKIYAELEAIEPLLQIEREIQQALQPSLEKDSVLKEDEAESFSSSLLKGCKQGLNAYALVVVYASIARFLNPWLYPLSALDRSIIGLSFLTLSSLVSLGSYFSRPKAAAGSSFFQAEKTDKMETCSPLEPAYPIDAKDLNFICTVS